MRILIDADGCPVVDITLKTAKENSVEVIIICDTSHEFNIPGTQTITVSKGADSADFKIVNLIESGDIVITQDYGLAAMCLARGAITLNQDGMHYTDQNIDALLLSRHTAKRIRMGGGRLKGNSKRTKDQDASFVKSLLTIISPNMD